MGLYYISSSCACPVGRPSSPVVSLNISNVASLSKPLFNASNLIKGTTSVPRDTFRKPDKEA